MAELELNLGNLSQDSGYTCVSARMCIATHRQMIAKELANGHKWRKRSVMWRVIITQPLFCENPERNTASAGKYKNKQLTRTCEIQV